MCLIIISRISSNRPSCAWWADDHHQGSWMTKVTIFSAFKICIILYSNQSQVFDDFITRVKNLKIWCEKKASKLSRARDKDGENSQVGIIFSSSLCALTPEQTNLNLCLIVWSEIQLTLNKSGERSKDGVKKRQASLAEQETETEKILTLVHYNSQVWIIFSLSLLMCLDPRTNKLELCLIVWSEIQIILNNPGEKSKDWVKKRQASLSEWDTESEKIVTLVHHESPYRPWSPE